MESMIEFVHQRISQNQYSIGIDFTMGNGHDTLFLAKYCQTVHSFDIQEQALVSSRQLVKDQGHVFLHLDSHEHFLNYVDHFDVGIFNLGYLPQGDHHITTQSDVTLNTLRQALIALNPLGHIYLVVYIGHEEGLKESALIDAYVASLDHKLYNVALFKMMNKDHAPYVLDIEKRK